MTDAVVAVRVIVRGRVQGVFFRATTLERATEFGVRGWVRNRSDGTVEAHFEGPVSAVEAIVAWCEIGSAAASVEGVLRENFPLEHGNGFRVRR